MGVGYSDTAVRTKIRSDRCIGVGCIPLAALNDGFDGLNEAIAIVGRVVGLEGGAQVGIALPLDDGDFDGELIPQALVVGAIGDGAERHLVPPGLAFVGYGLHASNLSDFLTHL